MKNSIIIATVISLFLISAPTAAEIYKCIDEKGQVTFTTKPGPGCTLLSGSASKPRKTTKNVETIPTPPEPIASKLDAKRIVRSFPCSKGGTIGDHIRNKTKLPAVKDLGWSVRQSGNQFIVEKTIHIGGLSSYTVYRWAVDSKGSVKAINGHAIGITKEEIISETTVTIQSVEGFSSGALGISRQSWESQHRLSEARSGFSLYEGLRYLVGYQNENVNHFERSWGETGIAKRQAMIEIEKMIPSDSKFIRSYSAPSSGSTVRLYFSKSLISRFPKTIGIGNSEFSLWTGGEPGNFIVIFKEKKGKVTRVLIAIGNNP
ncbi:MAG: DUF4124 domain-containing protein [Deltaproteobacteria bacterium]|nr:DUF4124 domain-containing protein [Deltaproteobacteria bacterium]